MKHLILFVLFLVFSHCCLAQEDRQYPNTDSIVLFDENDPLDTICIPPQKSGRDDGFFLRPQINLSANDIYGWMGILTWSLQIHCTLTYQLSAFMSVGIGTGLDAYYHQWNEFLITKTQPLAVSLPIYLNARYYVLDRKWSPYIELTSGFSISISDAYMDYIHYEQDEQGNYLYTNEYRNAYYSGGKVDVALGIQYKNVDCSVSINSFYWNCESSTYLIHMNFAYNIPLKSNHKQQLVP